MSCFISPTLNVRIEQMDGQFAPRPLPLENGFSEDKTYSPVGMFCPSESGEAYLILVNDRDELWFISNRHVRVVAAAEAKRPSGTRHSLDRLTSSPAHLNAPAHWHQ